MRKYLHIFVAAILSASSPTAASDSKDAQVIAGFLTSLQTPSEVKRSLAKAYRRAYVLELLEFSVKVQNPPAFQAELADTIADHVVVQVQANAINRCLSRVPQSEIKRVADVIREGKTQPPETMRDYWASPQSHLDRLRICKSQEMGVFGNQGRIHKELPPWHAPAEFAELLERTDTLAFPNRIVRKTLVGRFRSQAN